MTWIWFHKTLVSNNFVFVAVVVTDLIAIGINFINHFVAFSFSLSLRIDDDDINLIHGFFMFVFMFILIFLSLNFCIFFFSIDHNGFFFLSCLLPMIVCFQFNSIHWSIDFLLLFHTIGSYLWQGAIKYCRYC